MKLVSCISCGVVVDFDFCCQLYGSYEQWSRGSDETIITCCPVCKNELPEDSDYSHVIQKFKKRDINDE